MNSPARVDTFRHFNDGETLLTMEGQPMKIYLHEDAHPYSIHAARPIPVAWKDEVRKSLKTMVENGKIAPLYDNHMNGVT